MPPRVYVDYGSLSTSVHDDDEEYADYAESGQLADEVGPHQLPSRRAAERRRVVATRRRTEESHPGRNEKEYIRIYFL